MHAAVLIAERNDHIRSFVKRGLENLGFVVRTVKDFAGLREALTGTETFAAVVVDPELPGLSGASVIPVDRSAKTLVAALGHAGDETPPALAALCPNFVEKTPDLAELRRLLVSARPILPQTLKAVDNSRLQG